MVGWVGGRGPQLAHVKHYTFSYILRDMLLLLIKLLLLLLLSFAVLLLFML